MVKSPSPLTVSRNARPTRTQFKYCSSFNCSLLTGLVASAGSGGNGGEGAAHAEDKGLAKNLMQLLLLSISSNEISHGIRLRLSLTYFHRAWPTASFESALVPAPLILSARRHEKPFDGSLFFNGHGKVILRILVA